MSVPKINSFTKVCLLTSVTLFGLSSISSAIAGGIPKPPPNYPAPLPPITPLPKPMPTPPPMPMPPAPCCIPDDGGDQGGSSNFQASIDILGSYYQYQKNDGTTTTTTDRKFVELRPFVSYSNSSGGMDVDASLFSTFIYEIDGTPAYRVGRTEMDIIVKQQNNFAAGVSGSYEAVEFDSTTADPDGQSQYNNIEVNGFAEKNMGNFGLSLSGSYETDRYGNTLQKDGSTVDEGGLDEQKYGASLRINGNVSREVALFAEVNYDRKLFATEGTPSKNYTTLALRTGTVYNFNNAVALEVAGQYGRRTYDGTGGNVQDAYGADAKLVASAGRSLSASIGISGEYLKNDDATIEATKRMKIESEVNYNIANEVNLTASVDYDVTLSGPTKGKVLSADARINYAVHKNVDLYFGAEYGYEEDNNPGWKSKMGGTIGLTIHN